ncbi:MAG TPA: hypothetical protein VF351_06515 [Actinomycetota bacterium]
MAATILVIAPSAAVGFSCPYDDEALTFDQMIDQGSTGKAQYPVMILGVVRSLKDMGGDPEGGRTVARIEVVEHPVGYAPDESRVRFWRDSPDHMSLGLLQFAVGGRYVVIAHRNDDGSFRSDGTCGQTKRMTHEGFRQLVRYARSH